MNQCVFYSLILFWVIFSLQPYVRHVSKFCSVPPSLFGPQLRLRGDCFRGVLPLRFMHKQANSSGRLFGK